MSVVNLPPILRIMWIEMEARVRKLETAQVFQAPSFTADPTGLRNGMIWYRSDLGTFRCYQNGTVRTITTV